MRMWGKIQNRISQHAEKHLKLSFKNVHLYNPAACWSKINHFLWWTTHSSVEGNDDPEVEITQ